jgi:hypothetical protein
MIYRRIAENIRTTLYHARELTLLISCITYALFKGVRVVAGLKTSPSLRKDTYDANFSINHYMKSHYANLHVDVKPIPTMLHIFYLL